MQAKTEKNICNLLIGLLTDCFHRPNCHLAKVVIGAVIDIEIDVTLDTWQLADIRMLPELPTPFVLDTVHIVVGYPVGILVENGVVQVARLKFIIGVDDGLDVVVLLDNVQPLQHRRLELVIGLVLGFVLHVEHGWQVAVLQLHLTEEVLCLTVGRRVNAVEMVGTTGEPILTGLVEILTEILVGLRRAFGGLDHHETDGTAVNHTFVLQFVPIDMSLVVGDVNTVNLIPIRIADVTIERTPAETEGTDENIIEKPDVDSHDSSSTKPICPTRQMT